MIRTFTLDKSTSPTNNLRTGAATLSPVTPSCHSNKNWLRAAQSPHKLVLPLWLGDCYTITGACQMDTCSACANTCQDCVQHILQDCNTPQLNTLCKEATVIFGPHRTTYHRWIQTTSMAGMEVLCKLVNACKVPTPNPTHSLTSRLSIAKNCLGLCYLHMLYKMVYSEVYACTSYG